VLAGSEPQPARTIGRYALFAEIASGGMASIHIGRLLGPVGFARTVAVKRLHPQFARDPEFVTMFLDEARLAARVRHPNVAPILDVVATEGELFLVMEYLHGESLAQLVRAAQTAGKPIPQDIVRAVMSGILRGLHAAHEAKNERGEPLGIVHRDISPQNIHVGTDGVARLLDFGIAKAAGRSHVTRDRHVKGKLSYMAPEQLEEGEVDRRVDIYAAAVVLWELLTGKRLFDADSDESKLMRVLTSVVNRPSAVVPSVSASLDRVVLRGMHRNPKHRFATAREMAVALEASGRMASLSAIGAWVESVAHDALAERAAHVTAVEQCQDLSSDVASARLPRISVELTEDFSPTVTAPRSEPSFVEDSSVELVPVKPAAGLGSSDAAPVPSRSTRASARSSFTLAAVALLVISASVLVWLDLKRQSLHAMPKSAATLSPLMARGAALSLPTPFEARFASAPLSSDGPARDGRLTDTSASPNEPDTTAKIPPFSQLARGSRTKSKAVDCNPPFTLDAEGIRHYKRQCL
jgi:eukaryotic-like serine/threonine-protein kinase